MATPRRASGGETDIHRNYVGGIERGERSPTVKRIVVIANALEVNLDDPVPSSRRSADGAVGLAGERRRAGFVALGILD